MPLAEAGESGARVWSAQQREAVANDPAGLIAVSAAADTGKGASDPAEIAALEALVSICG